jgi:hypothetical protein
VAVMPPAPSIDVRRSAGEALDLTGRIQGTYQASMTTDAGKRYTFYGKGSVSPLHQSDLTGHVRLPGLVVTPVTGTGPVTPAVDAHGQIFLSDPGGTLTLTLTAPSRADAESLPDLFRYKVTNTSGRFRGDSGLGQLVIVVDPGASTSKGGALVEHGTFTLVFIPNSATTTGSS